MNNKNLLLGYGETLTGDVHIKSGNGPKNKPYTYEENRPFIMQNLRSLVDFVNNMPEATKPNGEAVAKITLHPAFLAKSYFPVKILKQFSLRSIGSKSVTISPRKQVKNKSKEEYNTACIYVAGTTKSFSDFYNSLDRGTLNKGQKDEVISLEEIKIFDANDKIKNIDQSAQERAIEVALHTPAEEDDILNSFIRYASLCGATVKEDKVISIKGLTFLPILANSKIAREVAEFSFLRTIRDLPGLRINNPVFTRTTVLNSQLELPDDNAINNDIKVAIFDGGIGCSDFDRWVSEHTFTAEQKTSGSLLSHGQDVTSTILFGAVADGQNQLPIPYSKIDHYRVLDNSINGQDSDLFDVLLRIKKVLDSNDYQYINLSLGPRLPVDDDDVHVWTSTLEQYFATGKTLCTVAVGNDGEKTGGLNRIQPPSDLVNALAVGAATSLSDNWERSSYSCIGPGRSPGYVKPDGVAFGGSAEEPFTLYSPFTNGLVKTAGTSFASPLVLRQAIGLSASLQYDITPLTAKALLIHHSRNNGYNRSEVGWGKFPHDIRDIIYCGDDEVKVIYQGELKPSQHLRASIPFPDIPVSGDVTLKATFCFTTPVDAEHPINYTRSGLVVTFRKNQNNQGGTFPLFNLKSIYADEQEQRGDAHKWETTLHSEKTFKKDTINDPCFDVIYYGREGGMPTAVEDLPNLPYVLIVTLKAHDTPELYNNIRQRYQTLQPIQIQQQIRLQS